MKMSDVLYGEDIGHAVAQVLDGNFTPEMAMAVAEALLVHDDLVETLKWLIIEARSAGNFVPHSIYTLLAKIDECS